jgi:cellulose synthase/poly-beta-1,6-N-acetylglucosamine synthase-like glycosyltransferase
MNIILYIIIILGIVNLLRLTTFMVGADWYELRRRRQQKAAAEVSQGKYTPFISVVIPAYNEEVCIIRTLESVLANDYMYKQIIIVDDGSSDKTYNRVRYYIRKHNLGIVKLVHQANKGKAAAINNGIKKHALGSLIMVLDADSLLHPQAMSKMVEYFRDPKVVAAATNVKVISGRSILNAAQRLEYVISHRMKRALTVMNMEYIVGGVGSTFRKSIVEKCEYYDTDTLTEDIDFTMKIITRQGNRDNRVVFAADVLAYTEGVTRFKSLIRQRFRWKYGRMQTFVKNREVFFSRDAKHTKQLSWLYLPFVVFSEFELLLDPLLTIFVLYYSFASRGIGGFVSAYVFVLLFSMINIFSENTESGRGKLRLTLLAPFSYGLLMIMSFVDFVALLKSLARLPKLFTGQAGVGHWEHVERTGGAVKVAA